EPARGRQSARAPDPADPRRAACRCRQFRGTRSRASSRLLSPLAGRDRSYITIRAPRRSEGSDEPSPAELDTPGASKYFNLATLFDISSSSVVRGSVTLIQPSGIALAPESGVDSSPGHR